MVRYRGLSSSSSMNSPSLYHRSISLNGSISKDHGRALKKFLIEMKGNNFDGIKFATYRAAAKLYFVQKTTNLHLVDIYNIIEAFRENGLNTLDHSAEIDEPRLECIIASIYYALYKRLPSTQDIDVERCIVILTQWIMHAYDSEGVGRIRVLSVKTALSTLCEGRLIDKFRYVFTQISENNGILNVAKLDNYLRDLLMLPCAVGEEPNFGYTEDILDLFFKPVGVLNRAHTKLDEFLDAFMNEKTNGVLFWLHMFNKLSKAAAVEHATQCKGCGKKDFTGLRYKCSQCYNYQLCQDCFWRDRISGTHKTEHDVREHSSWNKGERGTSVKKKLLCSPSKSAHPKLPDYPKEPEPNKQLDMSNIVPPLPSEPNSPNATLTRSPRLMNGSVSQHSNLSRASSSKFSQDSVTKQDDEHRLISLYAQRLATESLNQNLPSKASTSSITSEPSLEQKEMLSNLEERNRNLLQQIRQLKAEHDEAIMNAQQMGCDPNLLTELRVLRQRKDELEMRMSALQETRRELMVQLEGLMKLLKNNQVNSPRQPSRVASGYNLTEASPRKSSHPTGATGNTSLMRGVNGDVKEAFGKSNTKEVGEGQDLRVDLMTAVEEVTSAMTTVVKELTKDEQRPKPQTCNDDVTKEELLISTSHISNAEVSVY